jgi:hypothetical protein
VASIAYGERQCGQTSRLAESRGWLTKLEPLVSQASVQQLSNLPSSPSQATHKNTGTPSMLASLTKTLVTETHFANALHGNLQFDLFQISAEMHCAEPAHQRAEHVCLTVARQEHAMVLTTMRRLAVKY